MAGLCLELHYCTICGRLGFVPVCLACAGDYASVPANLIAQGLKEVVAQSEEGHGADPI